MKPWLLNLLACPIDKHHPLDAWLFKWETSEEELRSLASKTGKVDSSLQRDYRQLAKQLRDGTISPEAIRAIRDLTGSGSSRYLLDEALNALDRLMASPEMSGEELLQTMSSDIDRLYRFLNLTEVEVGLLVCPKCNRWYPIGSSVESVPELLPDELRDKNQDLSWMEQWRELIPDIVLNSGRPFNLGEREPS
jgi:uncharacterized protein YbaR (Trm112 family)